MSDLLHDLTGAFLSLPSYGRAALVLLLLYTIQVEIRFGAKARSYAASATDRRSTLVLSLVPLVPVLGFALTMKRRIPFPLPGMPAIAWAGVVVGAVGIFVRLWAVLVLRDRYTRTLLVHEEHTIERGGPYRFVRHPGYLGSLLCLNGIALGSGNALVFLASVVVTLAAYTYRIRTEETMLVAEFGEEYERYRRETGALLPSFRA